MDNGSRVKKMLPRTLTSPVGTFYFTKYSDKYSKFEKISVTYIGTRKFVLVGISY
jgi:hypothetical protein